jgi:hypothetical protein
MLLLDLERLARSARCLRHVGDGAKNFLGTLLRACLILGRRIAPRAVEPYVAVCHSAIARVGIHFWSRLIGTSILR